MACTRRIQILMEPQEYDEIEKIAQQRKTSVGALIREAVRERYLGSAADRLGAVERIAAMDLPVVDWNDAKTDIEDSYDAGLH